MSDELTKTAERRAIADEVESRLRDKTGGPHVQDSSEYIRGIARDEADRTTRALITEYQNKCVNEGPICGVWEEIGKMRSDIGAIKTEFAGERGEARGVLKAQGRQTTILVTAVTVLGFLANLAFNFWKTRHGG